MDNFTLINGSIIDHYVGIIRDKNSCKSTFSNAIENIMYLMIPDITSGFASSPKKVLTPMAEAVAASFSERVLIIPILRAGLAMLEPLKKVIPNTTFGYIGMKRKTDEVTGEIRADMYYCNLPSGLAGCKVLMLEVVIATGSSLIPAIEHLISNGAKQEDISVVSIISARPGLEVLHKAFPDIRLFACAVDDALDENGYIIPGLGDAGDRYNGYVH